MSDPILVGCIGAGGYASSHIQAFHRSVPPDAARLAAVATTRPEAVAQDPSVKAMGSRIFDSAEELLSQSELDAVIVPTGIDTHYRFSSRALEAGKHVLCEKPVTAVIQDALELCRLRDAAGRSVAVAYQDVYQPSCRWAKGLLASGDIGRLDTAKVMGLWPRPESYYRRNSWAGRIRSPEGWVLDSPIGNAFSHYLNLILWLTSPVLHACNTVTRLEAELYRSNPIESYDTCAVRAETETGCRLLMLFTHACEEREDPDLVMRGTDGMLHRRYTRSCRLYRGGDLVREMKDREERTALILENWLGSLRRPGGWPRSTGRQSTDGEDYGIYGIEEAAEAVRVVCRLAEGCAITDVNPPVSSSKPLPGGDTLHPIRGIEAVFRECYRSFLLPSETGMAHWSSEPKVLEMKGYETFSGPYQEPKSS
jgi:predicted dehydrogenase